MHGICKDNRGIALLITLSVITLMVTATFELNRRVRTTVFATATVRDRIRMTQMATAALHAAMALLIKDRMESRVDSHQEDWANPEKIAELLRSLSFEKGKVDLVIRDELNRIQVNALLDFPNRRNFNDAQRVLWDRFLRLPIFGNKDQAPDEDREPTAIINSLKDWLDSGDDDAITGLSGAESGYYQELTPPYACRNAPFRSLDEVILVKGITPEIFYGTADHPGISQYITVHGLREEAGQNEIYDGKININTAEVAVLSALLPPGSGDLAQTMLDYRQEMNEANYVHDLSNPAWYKEIPGFSGIEINPELIASSSDVFRVLATARLEEATMTLNAVVKRERIPTSGQWRCRILSWQTDNNNDTQAP